MVEKDETRKQGMRFCLFLMLVMTWHHIDTILSAYQHITHPRHQDTAQVKLSVLQTVKTVVAGGFQRPAILVLDHPHLRQSVIRDYPHVMVQILHQGTAHASHRHQLISFGIIDVHTRRGGNPNQATTVYEDMVSHGIDEGLTAACFLHTGELTGLGIHP